MELIVPDPEQLSILEPGERAKPRSIWSPSNEPIDPELKKRLDEAFGSDLKHPTVRLPSPLNVRAVLANVIDNDPREYNKVLNLAKKTGLPPPWLKITKKKAENISRLDKMTRDLYRFPGTKKLLSDPHNAQVAIKDKDIDNLKHTWLVRIAQSLAVIFILYSIITCFIPNEFIKSLVKWIAIPIAVLQVFGWLNKVSAYLDTINMRVGNIHISAHHITHWLVIELVLFWLSRVTNNTDQQVIRNIYTLKKVHARFFCKTISSYQRKFRYNTL